MNKRRKKTSARMARKPQKPTYKAKRTEQLKHQGKKRRNEKRQKLKDRKLRKKTHLSFTESRNKKSQAPFKFDKDGDTVVDQKGDQFLVRNNEDHQIYVKNADEVNAGKSDM